MSDALVGLDMAQTLLILIQVVICFIISSQLVKANDRRDYPNPKGKVMSINDLTDQWIGRHRPSYSAPSVTTSFSSTPSTTTPSTPPIRRVMKTKKKNKRRGSKSRTFQHHDLDDDMYYSSSNSEERYRFHDPDMDPEDSGMYYKRPRRTRPSSPYFISTSQSSPSPSSYSSGQLASGSTVKTVYSTSPSVARYVVRDPSKYSVRRIKSEPLTVRSTYRSTAPDFESQGMRRYDNPEDDFYSFGPQSNFGPQSSFPPRQVMNKISSPGQSQPCHGPECHQHHKGLVRFYWKRVVYPNGEDGRLRNLRPRNTRVRNQGRRRTRFRARSPSDQQETFHQQDDDEEDAEEEDNSNGDNDEEEEEGNSNRHNIWTPGRGYGHNLDEGSNYGSHEKRIYRDKRWAMKKWQQIMKKTRK